MTQERLVSYENSVKLKDLGFTGSCQTFNREDDPNIITFSLIGYSNSDLAICRPTQTHAQRWLLAKGYFITPSMGFFEFDKEADDVDDAKMLFGFIPQVQKITEIYKGKYEKEYLHCVELPEIQQNPILTVEDAIELGIEVAINDLIKNSYK